MKTILIDNFICKKKNQILQLLFQHGVFPHAIKIAVSLKNMQMRIHCFLFVGILFAQSEVVEQFPIATVGFEIAVFLIIKTIFFDEIKQLFRAFETFRIICKAIILHQCINKKRLTVNLLFGVGHSAIGIQHPVCSTKFFVEKVIENIVFGMLSSGFVCVVAKNTGRR